ncbi:MAG: hypothetical protein NUV57_00885 [archaeon]|nr:hypothetical protein [archaeon]
MVKNERTGILLRRKRTQYTPDKPTFHKINLEFFDYVAVIGKPSQKRPEAGDIFIPSAHIEQLVSQEKLELGEKLGENHYFIEIHNHEGKPTREIHQSSFDVFTTLAQKQLLPRVRQELAAIVNASILANLKKQFPGYKVGFSKKPMSIEEVQRGAKKAKGELIKKKPNLLKRRQRQR